MSNLMCKKKHHKKYKCNNRTDQMDTDDLLIRPGSDQFVLADRLVTHQSLIVGAVPQVHKATVVHLSRKYEQYWT